MVGDFGQGVCCCWGVGWGFQGAGGGRRGPGKLVLAASAVDESLPEGLPEAHQPPCRIRRSGRLRQHSLALSARLQLDFRREILNEPGMAARSCQMRCSGKGDFLLLAGFSTKRRASRRSINVLLAYS